MARTPHPLVVSLGLFTTLPMPAVATIDRRLAGRAMAWFPAVGVILGVLAGGVTWGVSALAGPLLGSVLGLAALAALTGALHLDGVADTADGLGSRAPAARALEIMRRSDIGPMGVVTLVFVLLIDAAALSSLIAAGTLLAGPVALVLAVVVGRAAVVCSTTPADAGARTQGFGALFHGVTSTATAVVWSVVAVLLAAAAGWGVAGLTGAVSLAAAAVVALCAGWLWRRRLARRLGGMTGDTFGSIIEVTQAVFLVAAAMGFGVSALA
ncbi:MAG: adenosylcobinamide-GDP ribazoletransferase [Arachnia sp.]